MEKLVELAELMLLSQAIEINPVRAENHRRDYKKGRSGRLEKQDKCAKDTRRRAAEAPGEREKNITIMSSIKL
jgi:hypothetical protein